MLDKAWNSIKTLLRLLRMANNEYIWHCPRERCRAIVFKTNRPFVMDGVFKCKVCNTQCTADDLLKANINHLKEFIKKIVDKKVDN